MILFVVGSVAALGIQAVEDVAQGRKAEALEQLAEPRLRAMEVVIVVHAHEPAGGLARLLGVDFPGMHVEHRGLPRGHQHGPRPVTVPDGFWEDRDSPDLLGAAADAYTSGG